MKTKTHIIGGAINNSEGADVLAKSVDTYLLGYKEEEILQKDFRVVERNGDILGIYFIITRGDK